MIIQEITNNQYYNQNVLAVKFNLSANVFQIRSSEENILQTILIDAIYKNFKELSNHITHQVIQFISSYIHTLKPHFSYKVAVKINKNQSQAFFTLNEISQKSV